MDKELKAQKKAQKKAYKKETPFSWALPTPVKGFAFKIHEGIILSTLIYFPLILPKGFLRRVVRRIFLFCPCLAP